MKRELVLEVRNLNCSLSVFCVYMTTWKFVHGWTLLCFLFGYSLCLVLQKVTTFRSLYIIQCRFPVPGADPGSGPERAPLLGHLFETKEKNWGVHNFIRALIRSCLRRFTFRNSQAGKLYFERQIFPFIVYVLGQTHAQLSTRYTAFCRFATGLYTCGLCLFW